jgi:hypothetical protein
MDQPELTAAFLSEIAAARREIRRQAFSRRYKKNWDNGGCWLVTEELERRYGWPAVGGCWLNFEGVHFSHVWNILPDGRIFDATADQFGQAAPGIRIVRGTDRRYTTTCNCEGGGYG